MSTTRPSGSVETDRTGHADAQARSLAMAGSALLGRAATSRPAGRPAKDQSAERSGLVVVGVHGSSSSRRALQHAVGVARARGWDVEVVTAWPDADDVLIHAVPGRYIVARGRAGEQQSEALASLDPELGRRAQAVLVNARPAQALLARSVDADLLVVGAGRSDRERGRQSVGTECVEAALCPVLVVPERRTRKARPTHRGDPNPSATTDRAARPADASAAV